MSVTWNTPFEASPAGGDSPALGDDKIREFKEAFRERFEHEHKMDLGVGTASLDGWHIQGSAISYIQTDAPTTRPDGSTALSALDNGRLWVDTDDNSFYFYVHGTGWVATAFIAHITSDGSDHGFIDQSVKTDASPSFSGGVIPAIFGSIGSLVNAASTDWEISTEYLPGTTVTGASLHYATDTPVASAALSGLEHDAMRISDTSKQNAGLTGTWRLLSRVYMASATSVYPIGLFQRIS